MQKLFLLLDERNFRNILKRYYTHRLNANVKDIDMMSNKKLDNTKIMRQTLILYCFKIFRLILILFTISYFIGVLWLKFIKDIEKEDNFYTVYNLDLKT